MCTKYFQDGDVHAYFSPYESPYDAYIAFMNAVSDLQLRVTEALRRAEVEEVVLPPAQGLWARIRAWLTRLMARVPFINGRMKVHTP